MAREDRALLGGLSPARFLARHWQKRPLLVRAAFPRFRDPIDAGRLAGLACEPYVESRLVQERGGARPWQATPGPQDPRRLRALPRTHWTLLVHDVDRHVPEVAALRERFGFLPRWRTDDVMVSVAAPQGSVGAHVDSYDVFLLQGRGRRRWRVGPVADPAMRPGLDLRILRRFTPAEEWVLEPGDMLYVPPGWGHHGVALEECLTYSIGFRAPSHAELLATWLGEVAAAGDRGRLDADPGRRPSAHPGEITRADAHRLRALVGPAWRAAWAGALDRAIGMVLTEPRREPPAAPRARLSASHVARRLRAGCGLAHAPGSRLAYLRTPRATLLFADGRPHALPPGLAFAAALLADEPRMPSAALRGRARDAPFCALVAALANEGALVLTAAARPRPRGSRRARGSR